VLPAVGVVEAATVVPAVVVPAGVIPDVVVSATVVLAAGILAAVVVARAAAVAVTVVAEERAACEQVAQRFGRQDAAADAEGDLACACQEALASGLLPAGWLLVRRPGTSVTRLAR